MKLDRANVTTDEIRRADTIAIEAGVADNYTEYFASLGPEWPYQFGSIQRGEFPLDKLPAHIRELARHHWYSRHG